MTPGQTETPLGSATDAAASLSPPHRHTSPSSDTADAASTAKETPTATDTPTAIATSGAAGIAGDPGATSAASGDMPPGGALPPSAEELALTPAILAAVTTSPPPTDTEVSTFLTPATLTRYLRARDGSVPGAAAALSATLDWRRRAMPGAAPCAGCVARPSAHSFVPLGTCVAGRPVVYSSFVGVTDKSGDGNEAHLAWALEELLGAADTRTYVWVMDFAGFGRADLSPAVGRRSLSLFAAHYPERLSAAIVVDAPPLFSALYRLLRPFIDPVTAAKLTMVRTVGGGAAALWDRLFPPELAARVTAEVADSRARAAAAGATAGPGPGGWARRMLGGGAPHGTPPAPPTAVKEGVWWTRPPLPGTGVPYIGGMILEARAAAGEGG